MIGQGWAVVEERGQGRDELPDRGTRQQAVFAVPAVEDGLEQLVQLPRLELERRSREQNSRPESPRPVPDGADRLTALAVIVRTYTGHDDRRERDSAGEAFRSPLAPWVLVASNVGSEGIDLHTFSSHLVHFDIEWNPARMEQREGRTDRFGRQLKEPVNVYFALVRGTYDERMLQQLVARQRWHSILLGRPGARLARDNKGVVNARILEESEVSALALDLRPS